MWTNCANTLCQRCYHTKLLVSQSNELHWTHTDTVRGESLQDRCECCECYTNPNIITNTCQTESAHTTKPDTGQTDSVHTAKPDTGQTDSVHTTKPDTGQTDSVHTTKPDHRSDRQRAHHKARHRSDRQRAHHQARHRSDRQRAHHQARHRSDCTIIKYPPNPVSTQPLPMTLRSGCAAMRVLLMKISQLKTIYFKFALRLRFSHVCTYE